ncbi:hypothetical protein Hypma_004112 [Hypsizygus marmoreus]|uniref:Uncharacterized protein n=1 Tax=Hypsizygus marmoreus TaxID=39966 RepID=A0A369K462_HYPMA|nr:hypothetical protein Hypma_004112 [Hypsizygus marmoreus]
MHWGHGEATSNVRPPFPSPLLFVASHEVNPPHIHLTPCQNSHVGSTGRDGIRLTTWVGGDDGAGRSSTSCLYVHDNHLRTFTSLQSVEFIRMDLPADESRYDHLLSTNDEPPDVAIPEIGRIIARNQSDLAKIEARIAEVQDMLHSLVECRNQKEQRLSLFRAIVSPIRRLPRDVLTDIFLFTREWRTESSMLDEFRSAPVGPLHTRSPLVITHVCTEWRRVALSMPILWARIEVDIQSDYDSSIPSSSPYHDERLHTWLERTGAHHPLDITYSGSGPSRHKTEHPAARLFWISPYAHRIKLLDLSYHVTGLPNRRFDILETLSLSKLDLIALCADGVDQSLFPSLRRLLLRDCDEIIPLHFIPWSQLTHLSLHSALIPQDPLRIILLQSTGLVKLHVNFRAVDRWFSNSPERVNEPIILPELYTLIVTDVDDRLWFSKNLTLPALTSLELPYDAWTKPSYPSFQSRSSFCLTSLKLSGHVIGVKLGPFLDIIRGMPSLTYIDLDTPFDFRPEFVASLASPDLLPNLQHVRMCSSTVYHVTDANFLQMVLLRDPLRKPAVVEPSPPPKTRIFRSHEPKRSRDGKFPALLEDQLIYIRGAKRLTVHIFF